MAKAQDEFFSNQKKHAPYASILDDYLRAIKPEDDIEYAIGKLITSGINLFARYRSLKRHKRFRAKLCLKKNQELCLKTLKIRDRTSTFRAVFQVLVEETTL